MKNVTRIAVAVALAAASVSASAWYAPYGYAPVMNEDQQKAFETQQKAFADHQAQIRLQAIEAQRKFAAEMAANHQKMVEQIAADQQAFAKRVAEDQQRQARQFEQDRALFARPADFGPMDVTSFDALRQRADEDREAAIKEMDARRAELKARSDEMVRQMEADRARFARPADFGPRDVTHFDALRQQADEDRAAAIKEMDARRAELKARHQERTNKREDERKAAYEQFVAEREQAMRAFPQPPVARPMDI